jgi:HEAT repeat protein
VRHAAAYALGQLGTAAAAEPLVAALHDTSPMVRGMAAEALAYLRDVSVMPSLLLALHDTSAEVRYWGAFAVGELGGEEAIPALRRLADSDEESAEGYGAVRNAAEEAILSILERVNQNGDRDTE